LSTFIEIANNFLKNYNVSNYSSDLYADLRSQIHWAEVEQARVRILEEKKTEELRFHQRTTAESPSTLRSDGGMIELDGKFRRIGGRTEFWNGYGWEKLK
jgi:hypothetical protein